MRITLTTVIYDSKTLICIIYPRHLTPRMYDNHFRHLSAPVPTIPPANFNQFFFCCFRTSVYAVKFISHTVKTIRQNLLVVAVKSHLKCPQQVVLLDSQTVAFRSNQDYHMAFPQIYEARSLPPLRPE